MESGLPEPVRYITLSELDADPDAAIELLEAGGALLVLSNDRERYFGVLTRDRMVMDAAEISQAVESGRWPALDELVKLADQDPVHPAKRR